MKLHGQQREHKSHTLPDRIYSVYTANPENNNPAWLLAWTGSSDPKTLRLLGSTVLTLTSRTYPKDGGTQLVVATRSPAHWVLRPSELQNKEGLGPIYMSYVCSYSWAKRTWIPYEDSALGPIVPSLYRNPCKSLQHYYPSIVLPEDYVELLRPPHRPSQTKPFS